MPRLLIIFTPEGVTGFFSIFMAVVFFPGRVSRNVTNIMTITPISILYLD